MEIVGVVPHFNCCSKFERNEGKVAVRKDIKLSYWNGV